MLKAPIVFFDTEYTAWEGSAERKWTGAGEFREIVQIGAIVITPDLSESVYFNCYVKPVRNPILSDYFVRLTGITQKMVNEFGVSLQQALSMFEFFSREKDLYSWGRDEEQLMENCDLLSIRFPIETSRCYDLFPVINPKLVELGIDAKKYRSGTLLNAFGHKGLPAHNGLNDCRNMLVVLQELRNRGRF